MSDDRLTEWLATRILGWKQAPGRFIKPGRRWMPTWRFKPLERMEDAFLLLDRLESTYTLAVGSEGVFTAQVRIGGRIGLATGNPKARTITLAIARALSSEAIA